MAEARSLGQVEPPMTIRTGATTDWQMESLKSELDTLACINAAKETELRLLRRQLERREEVGANEGWCGKSTSALQPRLDVSAPANRGDPIVTTTTTTLLESFSHASPRALEQTLEFIEKSLGVRNIQQLVPAVARLVHQTDRHAELVRAVCACANLRADEANVNCALKILQQLSSLNPASRVKDAVTKPAGVAWTLH